MQRHLSTPVALMITLAAVFVAIDRPGAQAPQTPAAPAPAQPAATAPAPAAPTLTYEMAKQVIDAAEAEARRNKWNVAIVVTDAAGIPVMLRRLDGAGARPYDIAMRKAATVVASKMATSAYGEQLKAGGVKEVPNGITFAGGVPIMRGAELIGAVGTSGVRAIEDEQISKAGVAVIK
ncbi:MAG TPA: heme-binding protein [Vicinamibacterales bacterium]|nr:heme-binding protein [Vicinamibacterales bacterium]